MNQNKKNLENNNEIKTTQSIKRVVIKNTSSLKDEKIHPFEIAKILGAIPMGNVDYYTAKTLYHTPGFKEQKQKEMDEYFKNKENKENKENKD